MDYPLLTFSQLKAFEGTFTFHSPKRHYRITFDYKVPKSIHHPLDPPPVWLQCFWTFLCYYEDEGLGVGLEYPVSIKSLYSILNDLRDSEMYLKENLSTGDILNPKSLIIKMFSYLFRARKRLGRVTDDGQECTKVSSSEGVPPPRDLLFRSIEDVDFLVGEPIVTVSPVTLVRSNADEKVDAKDKDEDAFQRRELLASLQAPERSDEKTYAYLQSRIIAVSLGTPSSESRLRDRRTSGVSALLRPSSPFIGLMFYASTIRRSMEVYGTALIGQRQYERSRAKKHIRRRSGPKITFRSNLSC